MIRARVKLCLRVSICVLLLFPVISVITWGGTVSLTLSAAPGEVSRGGTLTFSSVIANSGVSSLGHAIPAAIGARFAEHKPTIAIIGDGGFQMCCMELMTAVNYDLPITVVMFNNSTMGLIRKNQYQSYEQRYLDCDFVNPDYALLAKSFGIGFQHVETEADLESLFEDTDFDKGINLVEIMLDKDAFPNYSSLRN